MERLHVAFEIFYDVVPPWRQPRGNLKVSLVNSHTNATRIGWHLWEIDLRFAPGSCLETGERLHVAFEIFYDVVSTAPPPATGVPRS